MQDEGNKEESMELSQEDKDRIIAEEKLRLETRKEFLKEHMYSGCGSRRCGWGLFRGLAFLLLLFALFHCWHRPYCGWGPGYCNHPVTQTPQAAPSPAPSGK